MRAWTHIWVSGGHEESELQENTVVLREGTHKESSVKERREEDATKGQHPSFHSCV